MFYPLLVGFGIKLIHRYISRKSESKPEKVKKKPAKDEKRSVRESEKTEKKRPGLVILSIATPVLVYLKMLYSIFLPLKLDTTWFYAGFTVYLAGLIISTIARANFVFTRIEKEPITKGAYRFSRHPMYVAAFLLYTGAGIATASWLFLLLAAASTVSSVIFAFLEERHCLEFYGEAYKEYMARTPRWLGLPRRVDKTRIKRSIETKGE